MNRISAEFDAAIIGAGVSGLSAAVTLAESGARVIVFEKQPSVGGTSVNFRGIFAAESEMQRKRYITYTRDEAFKNIMEYSHWRANPRLVRAIVNESAGTIAWLQKQGVVFYNVVTNIPGAPQTYHLVKDSGADVIKVLTVKAHELGITIKLAAPVKKILRTNEQTVAVIAEENGVKIQVDSKTVIIASGGYANNKDWIKKYTGLDLDIDLIPIGNEGKMGDGIRMAYDVGAAAANFLSRSWLVERFKSRVADHCLEWLDSRIERGNRAASIISSPWDGEPRPVHSLWFLGVLVGMAGLFGIWRVGLWSWMTSCLLLKRESCSALFRFKKATCC